MKLFRTILLGCFILVEVFIAQAQTILIKGRVLDSEKEEGIAYVSIAIAGTYTGTASNTDGYFELRLPENLSEQALFFSAIGYKNKQIPVKELVNESFILVQLDAQSYDIEEVNVEARSKVLFRILRSASEKINENYLEGPFNLKLYSSEEKNSSGTKKNRQAIVKLYDENGYQKPSVKEAFQSRNYRIEEVKKNYDSYSFPDGQTGLDELLETDMVRLRNIILNPNLIIDFKLTLEDKTVFNGDSVWIISYETEKTDLAHTGCFNAESLQGKIYIRLADFVVLRNELNIRMSKENPLGKSLAVKDFSNKDVFLHTIVGYKMSAPGKYLPDFIQSEKNYIDDKGVKVNSSKKVIVFEIQTSNPEKINNRDYFEDIKTDEEFWNRFVVPQ